VHKRVEFVAIESDSQRETLLYSIWTPFSLEQVTLNLPAIHHTFVNEIFETAQLPVLLKENYISPKTELSKFNIDKKDVDNLATISLDKPGKEWLVELKRIVRDLNAENIITFHLRIPAWEKIPADLENQLNSIGFFFAGVIPHTPQNWWINYTRLDNQKFDFEKVHTEGENATKLKDYINSCYNTVSDI
jgi:hypothetical protein